MSYAWLNFYAKLLLIMYININK